MTEPSAVSVAAIKLRDAITSALKVFDEESGHMRPDISIRWHDVTEVTDDHVVYEPTVRIEVKVFV